MENLTRIETHQEIKARHQKEVNEFSGLFFAFSNEQLREGLEKVGVPYEQAKERIYSLGAGGYILKEQSPAFHAMFKRHDQERKDRLKDEKALIESLVYELGNHEYCITYDATDALDSLGLTKEDVDPIVLKKAIRKYTDGVNLD